MHVVPSVCMHSCAVGMPRGGGVCGEETEPWRTPPTNTRHRHKAYSTHRDVALPCSQTSAPMDYSPHTHTHCSMQWDLYTYTLTILHYYCAMNIHEVWVCKLATEGFLSGEGSRNKVFRLFMFVVFLRCSHSLHAS